MQSPEDKNLEQFIHRKLKALPEKPAPEHFASNVMAALARRAELPWYKQPWSQWPAFNQNLFLALLMLGVGALCWFALPLAARVSIESMVAKVELISWIPQVLQSLGSAVVIAGKTVRLEWIIGAVAALALFYAWCIAAGVALFRVAQRKFTF